MNADAESYTIYRATSKKGTYKAIATTTENNYTDTAVKKTATTYYYKVCVITKINGTEYKGKMSSVVSITTPIPAVTISSAKNVKGKAVQLKWKKISGVSGYEIYCAKGYTGKYKKIKTITKAGTVSYKNTKLKKGSTYYYKIRAYKVVDGKKIYGYDSSQCYVVVQK